MSKRTKVIIIIAVAAVAAYLAYRWYKSRQEGSGGGGPAALGSNLNSPAPELGAPGSASSPMVGPAVSIPVEIRISHATEGPDTAANPYNNMIGQPPVGTPLGGLGKRRPWTRMPMAIYPTGDSDDTDLGKDGASTYATTLERGG